MRTTDWQGYAELRRILIREFKSAKLDKLVALVKEILAGKMEDPSTGNPSLTLPIKW